MEGSAFIGRIPLASDVQYPQFAGSMWYHGERHRFGFTSDVISLLERRNWPIHSAYPFALSVRR